MKPTVLEYVIEQADIFDQSNYRHEQDIIDRTLKIYDIHGDEIMDVISAFGEIDSMNRCQTLQNLISNIIKRMYNAEYKLLMSQIEDYMITGYDNMNTLIEVGMEMERKAREQQVSELSKHKRIVPDPNAVKYMKNHAFEYLKGASANTTMKLKGAVSSMMVTGWDKKKLEDSVYNILASARISKARSIAQSEMSMAYNNGALMRLREFNKMNTTKMMKYWHGFKYSKKTCSYCRPRIGRKYHVDDNTEELPAHVNCRCVWLPYLETWDQPISNLFYRNADMIKRVYSKEDIYRRMNERLGITYAEHINLNDAIKYLSGDRGKKVNNALEGARQSAMDSIVKQFDIAQEESTKHMGKEFNIQMRFWKKYVSECYVNNEYSHIEDAKVAIKGVMILPWSGKQLTKWNKLLNKIDEYLL